MTAPPMPPPAFATIWPLRDDRIQVITQKNAGICAARNRGLSVAEGMYVTFCDDDDLLLPGALALLLQKAEDTGADIVRADYELIHISPDGTETPQPHPAGTACDLAARRRLPQVPAKQRPAIRLECPLPPLGHRQSAL